MKLSLKYTHILYVLFSLIFTVHSVFACSHSSIKHDIMLAPTVIYTSQNGVICSPLPDQTPNKVFVKDPIFMILASSCDICIRTQISQIDLMLYDQIALSMCD